MRKTGQRNLMAAAGFATMLLLSGCCGSKVDTAVADASPTKYIEGFHRQNFSVDEDGIGKDQLALYVDYSTCIAQGQNSQFFTAIVPSLTSATKRYISIKGDSIKQEEGETYSLLKTIKEVNYADLKGASEQIAADKTEAVLLTDGEYFQKSIAKSNVNNPYMEESLKKWLKRGHDIYVLVEPYVEQNNGNAYNKKRFYFIFTDNRIPDNIYSRIEKTVDLTKYPDVTVFHLSISHPALLTNKTDGTLVAVDDNVLPKTKGYGSFEVQEWQTDWKNILSLVRDAEAEDGSALPNGNPIFQNFGIDRNSYGGYRIADIGLRVYDVSEPYAEFYDAKVNGLKVGKCNAALLDSYENFLILDKKEFQNHSRVKVYFDAQMFDPSVLTASPYNFTKVDFFVDKVDNVFDQYANLFTFESIDVPGATNTSVAESIRQCLADPEVAEAMKATPIYSIYVASLEYSE